MVARAIKEQKQRNEIGRLTMIDIYSDEILTAPPRVVHRVKAALAMTSEAAFCKAMEGALIAEREAETPEAQPSPVERIEPTAGDRILQAIERLGEADLPEVTAMTGLCRMLARRGVRKLCADGKIVSRRRSSNLSILYRLPSTPPINRQTFRDDFLAAIAERGESETSVIAQIINRQHVNCSRLAARLHAEGALDRRRSPTSSAYLYRIAGAEAHSGPPRHQVEHSAACGAETHGCAPTGKNVVVL
jgi:hypothetical protein